ncbi:MAG: hypothetical protein ACREEW_01325 [Caulobacteraceae bacterium]
MMPIDRYVIREGKSSYEASGPHARTGLWCFALLRLARLAVICVAGGSGAAAVVKFLMGG